MDWPGNGRSTPFSITVYDLEGVDLAGDRLIGCAIVGVGLPQVSPRQEMLRRYYDAQNGAGFDYAYRWPGMNKVLQAAGRVIRTQEDKGVVLLLDDRFAQSEYARLFPKHWRHLEYLRDTEELKKKLAEFWGDALKPLPLGEVSRKATERSRQLR